MSHKFMFVCIFLQKSPFYVLLFGGLSFAAYAIQLAYRNLRLILQEYWHAALGKVAFVISKWWKIDLVYKVKKLEQ